jgi:hypothetical protein
MMDEAIACQRVTAHPPWSYEASDVNIGLSAANSSNDFGECLLDEIAQLDHRMPTLNLARPASLGR